VTSPNFNPIARPYRWLEYLSFGPMLQRCRCYRLPQLTEARRALVLGDGDGRFLARLLRENSLVRVDAVDLSTAMLRLLGERVADAGASERVTLHRADVRVFMPTATYDLVVTHFFLDCFTTDELRALAERLRKHLSGDARWVISEFAIPAGWAGIPAKLLVWGLYAAFGVLTGLRLRRLPDYAQALTGAGLVPGEKKSRLGGLLVSELWEVKATPTGLDRSHP
jgi:SAM-dependent methyltransferase